MCRALPCVVMCGALTGQARAQNDRITAISNGVLAANLAFSGASLTPARTNTPITTTISFLLRDRSVAPRDPGYRLDAVLASFTAPPASEAGISISAADIGVGITSVQAGPNALAPRNDVVAPLFDYDPGAIVATNGLTPYTGRGTLASLAFSTRMLSGSTIGEDVKLDTPGNFVTATMKFGLLPQYWSPGPFSATILLTISKGP